MVFQHISQRDRRWKTVFGSLSFEDGTWSVRLVIRRSSSEFREDLLALFPGPILGMDAFNFSIGRSNRGQSHVRMSPKRDEMDDVKRLDC